MATRTKNSVDANRTTRRSPVQTGALVVGAVFVLVGIMGFIPGITTNYDQLEWAGPDSEAMLLGIFMVSILHNLLHLGLGVVGLIAAKAAGAARSYLIAGGLVYAVLWIYGLVVAEESQANFVPLNDADDWLHLVLAVGMILLGLILPRRVELPASER
ncbi:DUF4383 domain-containing protein [Paenibacillus sp. TRM 82003]|uniref:DUF4383 domain-containing protein n=1 Tax=Kineococcus sp. TRM81007 TaxID=2925831 RepID=UPI001F57AA0E|nr:DUF4383 domain-containing protein [Kineococcus sp. TRM81007]MCI2239823.1 DUF4383 domain-containing protein [Kineococcus sp. TRM81007]MCI3925874.1 DUF4383 domain-containing protein [Paenibacillus sp. TRM 82003]